MSKTEFSPYGVDLFGDPIKQETKSPVAKEFIMPPFSILNARDGAWQERKRAWAEMGIASELGREGGMTHAMPTQSYSAENMKEEYYGEEAQKLNTSIFDPVVCELMYSWFSGKGAQVVDPFAGGSVRGIVASCLGRKYWGGELRGEQVEANRKQGAELCPDDGALHWEQGDSMQTLDGAPDADFVFSCPPYGDLEVYSDDPGDISNMEYHTFKAAYGRIILKAVKRLKQDRFACFVVGDFRDKKGFYRNFVSDTIAAFEAAGARYYNEGILVTSVGSASMRARRIFNGGRKLIKTHQNILVFCKGDWKKATKAAKS
jgi:DNA modification methylase